MRRVGWRNRKRRASPQASRMLEGSEDWTNDDPTSERQRQFKIAPRYGQIHFPRRMKHCPERTSKRLIPRRVRRLRNTGWPLLTKRRRSSDAQRQPTKSSGASFGTGARRLPPEASNFFAFEKARIRRAHYHRDGQTDLPVPCGGRE